MKRKYFLTAIFACLLGLSSISFFSCKKEDANDDSSATETEHVEHTWNDGAITLNPTCTNAGELVYTCTHETCNQTKTEQIPALEHDLVQTQSVAATCTQDGMEAYESCTRCSYVSAHEIIPALTHDTQMHEALVATCTTAGHDAYQTCSRCEYSTYVEIPALNHTLQSYDGQEATYETDGWTAYEECTRDGCTYTTYQILPALKHHTVEFPAQAATCTQDGWDAYLYCTDEDCDYSTFEQQKIPALGHDEVPHEALVATCTTAGHDAYETCSRCEYSTYEEIPALNHDLQDYGAQNATCTQDGWNAHQTCRRENCNYTTKTIIPATGHTHELSSSLEVTCTADGYYTYTCINCDDFYTETFSATGHNKDDDGYCDACDTQIETYTSTITTAPTLSTVYARQQASVSGGTVTASNGKTLTGTWSVEDTTAFTHSGDSTTLVYPTKVTVTFTPENTNAYPTVSTQLSLSLYAVASYNGVYYSTVDDALSAANAANTGTVYALPSNYATETAAITAKTISQTSEIKSGVTLALPWTMDTEKTASYTASAKAKTQDITLLALTLTNDGHAFQKESVYLVNNVTIANTLTNNGKIIVGGVFSAQAKSPAASLTSGKYGQLTLDNARLINNGELNCYGYIRERTDGTCEIVNNGSIQIPFSIVEQRGGGIFLGYYRHGLQNNFTATNGGSAPFNRFFTANIFVKIINNPNASINGYVDLYANSEHNETTVQLIATNDTSALLNLSKNAVLETECSDETLITDLHFYGDFSLNSLSLSINFKDVLPVDIGTEKVLLPLSWYYNVYAHRYKTGENSTVSLNQSIKLLPGTKMIIDEGVTVNADYLVVYDAFPEASDACGSRVYYEENGEYVAYEKEYNVPAAFIVNGTLNVNTVGGKILTQTNGATLNVTKSNKGLVREIDSVKDASWNLVITNVDYQQPIFSESYLYLFLPVYANGTVQNNANATVGKYVSFGGGWVNVTTEFTINYVFTDENGNAVTDADNTLNPTAYSISTLTAFSTPTRATSGYALEGWYLDSAHTVRIQTLSGSVLWDNYHGEATIYGKWIQATQYLVSFDFDNATTGYDLSYAAIVAVENSTLTLSDFATLTQTTLLYDTDYNAQYYFDGWYFNGQKVTQVAVSEDITLTAKWAKKVVLTVTVKNSTGWTDSINEYSVSVGLATLESGNPATGANTSNTYYAKAGETLTVSLSSGSGLLGGAASMTVAGTKTTVAKGKTGTASYTLRETDTAITISITKA